MDALKVKFFSGYQDEGLEQDVNSWLAKQPRMKVQDWTTNFHNGRIQVAIWYMEIDKKSKDN